jgi:saccharopine dehydrogenase-like NADP-dependent oxidoreductase
MERSTLLILGGYGTTGRLLARLLLQETDLRLCLAGRSAEKAAAVAAELNRQFEGHRVAAAYADASDRDSLMPPFQDVGFVLVASSTSQYASTVATAAVEAGIDYLDIQYSSAKTKLLKRMAPEIETAGRCFITDGGFHPGLPAALIRYTAGHFDRLERANVGSVIRQDWAGLSLSDATVIEFLAEIGDYESLFFKEGRWQKARLLGMLDTLTMDFGGAFGRSYCVPMFLEELRPLPELFPPLKETGFFVSGFNWFVDWLAVPLGMLALRLRSEAVNRRMARLLHWGLVTYSKPPFGTALKVEAQGLRDGRAATMDVTLAHEDGYVLTAIPVVACLLQYLDGSIGGPGLWTQANIVEPERLMADLERMGITIGKERSWQSQI